MLADAGVDAPRRDATAIWASVAGISAGEVWLRRGAPAPPQSLDRFRAGLARRVGGEPLAYVVGRVGFRLLEIVVDRRVLIPRPETEGIVDRVLAWGEARGGRPGSWGRALDVCTGSGCVALSLATEARFAEVVATDVSAEALEVAAENASRTAATVPVRLERGAFFEPVVRECFDVIVGNPPYVTAAEYAGLEDAVRRWEPRSALVAGDDGLEHLRILLETGRPRMVPGGLLVLEVDCARARETRDVAVAAGWRDVRIERDLFDRDRYLLATGAK